MDLKKLKIGELLVAGGSVALLVVAFFSWYKVEFPGIAGYSKDTTVSASGYDAGGILWLAILLGLAASAALLIPVFAPDTKLPETGSVPLAKIAGGLAIASGVFTLIRLFDKDETDWAWGAYLGFLVAFAIIAGGALVFTGKQDEISLGGFDGSGSTPSNGGGTTPPPPPPA